MSAQSVVAECSSIVRSIDIIIQEQYSNILVNRKYNNGMVVFGFSVLVWQASTLPYLLECKTGCFP